jgi:hypothetical protein
MIKKLTLSAAFLLVAGIAVAQLVTGNSSIQGSYATALADNTAKTYATVDVPVQGYSGGDIVYTLFCQDANDRVTRSGRTPFSAQGGDTGTVTCTTGTATTSGDSTDNSKSFSTVTFACTAGTGVANLRITADCSITTPTLITIQWRLDMPQTRNVSPLP